MLLFLVQTRVQKIIKLIQALHVSCKVTWTFTVNGTDEINELLVIINEFRRHAVTQNLALQNLDNVLAEVMKDDFYSTDHAL